MFSQIGLEKVDEIKTELKLIKHSLQKREFDHWPWNPERMGDGCKHVFLDLGANIGVHNRFLFEPAYYPGTFMQDVFSNAFGHELDRSLPSLESGICTFAFEANPAHTKRLRLMEQCYAARGLRLKVFVPSAVSDDRNESLFFEKLRNDNDVMWGGRVLSQRQMHTLKRDELEESKFTQVYGVDIALFVNQHIKNREYDRSHGNGTVVAKMDIEGSEFYVLPHMERAGVLCKGVIDLISAEFHGRDGVDMPYFASDQRFPDLQSFKAYFGNYERPEGHKCGNPSSIMMKDSEKYLFDLAHPLEQNCPLNLYANPRLHQRMHQRLHSFQYQYDT
jgi:hypothetical protein